MQHLPFMYLQFTHKLVNSLFPAVNIEGVLYPIWGQSFDGSNPAPKSSHVFIRGRGEVKIKPGDVVPVPALKDGTREAVIAYVEEYGHRCLHYAITGESMEIKTFTERKTVLECNAISIVGAARVMDYVARVHEFNKRLREIYLSTYQTEIDTTGRYRYTGEAPGRFEPGELFMVRIDYHHLLYATPGHLDYARDDQHLGDTYDVLLGYAKWYGVTFPHLIVKPVSMRSRLTILFGREVADMYWDLVSNNDFMASLPLDVTAQF